MTLRAAGKRIAPDDLVSLRINLGNLINPVDGDEDMPRRSIILRVTSPAGKLYRSNSPIGFRDEALCLRPARQVRHGD